MKTAKALGFAKGDFIMTGCGFPGIIMGNAHTSTPLCEVWGWEHEMGSVYTEELVKTNKEVFVAHELYKRDPNPRSPEAIKALSETPKEKRPARMPQPSMSELEEMMADGECYATDGCVVEPDGKCPHGCRSWLLELEMI